jgi:hypothetical protein
VRVRTLCSRAEIAAGALLLLAALFLLVRVLRLGRADPHGVLYLVIGFFGGLGLLLVLAGLALRRSGRRALLTQIPALLWGGAVLWYVLQLPG